MFSNYLKIAFRNLIKHKFYSVINISGLAIGIAACLLMMLYVQDEISYDRFYENSENIYRLHQEMDMGSAISATATVPWPVMPALQKDFPEIENGARIYRPGGWGNAPVVHYEDQEFIEPDFVFAEAAILDIFDFEFHKGNPATALESPTHVLITEKIAKKYFGDADPIGKTIRYNNNTDWEIAGVLKNIPHNSHIKFDFLASFDGMRAMWNNWQGFTNNWAWVAAWSYLELPDAQYAERLRAQLPEFVQRHYPAALQDGNIKLHIEAINDIHLHSNKEMEFETNSNIMYVYVFSAIAALILLIACINFMNLATARSAGRAKEVGMRKVLGAYRIALMKQFIGEALLLSFISMVLAVILIEIALPWFNDLTGKFLAMQYLDNWFILGALVLLGLFVGVISGSYPAFFLSAFRPVEVLKGSISLGARSTMLRKVLVISQFVVSITLLICIGIIYNQLDYLRSKDLGFNKEQVVLVNMYGGIWNQYIPFKNDLLKNPAILGVTQVGGSIPGAQNSVENAYFAEGHEPDKQNWLGTMWVNHDFVDVLGLEIIEGRPFDARRSSDSSAAVLLNETAVQALGWKGSAIGKSIKHVQANGSVNMEGEVIGVVKDFHFRPLHEPLRPLVLRFGGGKFAIRVAPGEIQETMAHIKTTWESFVPNWPISYQFVDQNLENLYQKDQKFSKVIQYFTLLAIFIACLGLLGLASFTAERRTKEIGVRKVLGATTGNLVLLISKDFTMLVAVAFLIAAPIAYFTASRWLQEFAYRTDIGPGIFIMAGLIALGIALVTVGYHAVKAALTNPVRSLRYE